MSAKLEFFATSAQSIPRHWPLSTQSAGVPETQRCHGSKSAKRRARRGCTSWCQTHESWEEKHWTEYHWPWHTHCTSLYIPVAIYAMFYRNAPMNCKQGRHGLHVLSGWSQVADNAEDQVPFRAWLFRGNPMPQKKVGRGEDINLHQICVASFQVFLSPVSSRMAWQNMNKTWPDLTRPANVCAKMFKVFLVSRLLLSWCRMCHKHSHMSVRIQADLRPSFLWQVSLVRANMLWQPGIKVNIKDHQSMFCVVFWLAGSHTISQDLRGPIHMFFASWNFRVFWESHETVRSETSIAGTKQHIFDAW